MELPSDGARPGSRRRACNVCGRQTTSSRIFRAPAAPNPVAARHSDPAAVVRRTRSAGCQLVTEHGVRCLEIEIYRSRARPRRRRPSGDTACGKAVRCAIRRAMALGYAGWLGLVRGGVDRRRQLAGPCQRVGSAHIIHRGTPRAHRSRPLRLGARSLSMERGVARNVEVLR